jgi:hypothetical protein
MAGDEVCPEGPQSSMPAKQGQRRTFYPTCLTAYEQCPERYYHQYVEKRPIPDDFVDLALERGRAVHRVLYDVALEYMEHETIPSDIPEQAAVALKRAPYSSPEEWCRDLEIVIRDIEFGLGQFDDKARVLAAERKYFREFPETSEDPFFVLEAKVDLVLHRVYDDGLLFLDVVDFKSGKGTSYPIQEYVCQTVVERHAPRYRVPFNYVRNTTVRTSQGEIVSTVIDGDEHDYLSAHVKNLVKAIYKDYEESNWRPVESGRCRWCPYCEDGCSLAPSLEGANQPLGMLDAIDS